MKIVVTTFIVVFVAFFSPSLGATPPPWSAKFQLPAQASDKANPPSKAAVEIPPVPVPPPPPPAPQIPVIIVTFASGQTTDTASQAEAAKAIASATTTVKTKIAQSNSISIITIIGKRDLLRMTHLPPRGRSGDLETTHWRLTDRFGRRIGDGNALCRWASRGRRLCWGELRLPRGRLVIIGSSQTRILGEFAVIGGTGVYTFKQGMMTVRELSIGKFVIRILLA